MLRCAQLSVCIAHLSVCISHLRQAAGVGGLGFTQSLYPGAGFLAPSLTV